MNMIKTITKALSIILLTIGLSSQGKAQSMPEFGVKGGLNYSTFNDTEDVEYKTGFLVGAYANFKIPLSPVSVQPEILFAQYGAKAENADFQFNVNYVQIPVLLKFGFETPGAQPNVYFGPYMSFNTKAEVANNDGSFNLEDDAKDNEFGVIVGAGIDVSKLRLGLRYTAGLTNVAEDNFNDSAKNGAIALTVGIAF
ncbi:MAG TPA: hypothetical protein DF712_02155 [Balneola sp.]|jgi:hypothetical protein|nr:hypothetical protein [Bacteroidota bacterium]MAC05937.1 hypothetical protein [Balneola sp.]MAO77462.1 hypothetical protein [Balneola sp.]MBF65420.1 hypothetical protein [Balneola sp.]HAH51274.1 hypothetical protein [Balneola sp.]|tara:strand:- start:6604 stop:7194 length:591 start_codon:yes stop_codon:yes gene_type:complete